jgi:hypothetical protein
MAEVHEIETADLGEPDCKLVNPLKVWCDKLTNQFGMRRWPEYTDQKEVIIHSDSILTLVNPTEKHTELYLKTIK